ncbi:energy-coupling factor transporter transmembrane component T family protein [Limosilactobacillus equigenerosi]|uniref:ABC transporter permease component n=1 Tax=Limosilactobacillus equigenerosi DSM 18793 = JCM 14505 TaxID=1423742 RepID=A0A0R1USJ0_9LACO|nr:energy-coupling factor transporter transmembrane component T [Limosilactobacillus equigenerosi]KRL96129.1 ABC transporter permease component [Limosilactobacillus equigenerosi DSM 18793 = JCM 14505]
MQTKVLFGSYVPISSWWHQLNARIKLILCLWFVCLVFIANNWLSNLVLVGLLMLTMLTTRVPLKFYWHGIRGLLAVIAMTVLIQLLFSSGGEVYWHWWIFTITANGLRQCGTIFLRFFLIINVSTALTATTDSLSLANGLAALLKPLKVLKVPVNQITMMIAIALRFVPTLFNEVNVIMNAQRARGVRFNQGGLVHRLRSLVPIMVPLLVGSFKRADELATAMEARGYDPDASRSQYRIMQWKRIDTWLVIVMVAITCSLIWLRK